MAEAGEVDVLARSRCGGRLRLVGLLEAGALTVRILRHLGLLLGGAGGASGTSPPLSSSDEAE